MTRIQVEAALLYLDYHRAAVTDTNQVIQDCVLKVDLINKLMALNKIDRQSSRG
ncbi:hypothetical protein [Adhaeribacter arboris]|nr:hypothetical protein [Adhaeribacter arboris]